jgi:hypothetical protein
MMYPNVMVPRVSVVIDKAFGGAYCAMDSLTTSRRPRFCRHYGFTTGQIAVMGKEAGPFFTYGPDGGDAVRRDGLQERYEAEYLNMRLAFAGRFVVPLEPEALRQCLLTDIPEMYVQYQHYSNLVRELDMVDPCPTLYRELPKLCVVSSSTLSIDAHRKYPSMSLTSPAPPNRSAPMAVDTMRTLIVCRGPIAFETLEVYRRCHWQLPHVVISSREWIAELQRTAPWIAGLPSIRALHPGYNDGEAILHVQATA